MRDDDSDEEASSASEVVNCDKKRKEIKRPRGKKAAMSELNQPGIFFDINKKKLMTLADAMVPLWNK